MTSPRTKQRHKHHIKGDRGVNLVRRKLPDYWVVRDIYPDYGLDLHVEVFEPDARDEDSANTLGEHFYVQVKTVENAQIEKIVVRSRGNVAKYDPGPGEGDSVEIGVVKFSIDTATVLTVEAMGAAVPVLLCVVDVSTETVYYVCLNDYVTKVLQPWKPRYEEQGSITVMVPSWNVLDSADPSFAYLWLLARRGKFYAAFNTLAYQYHELRRSAPSGHVTAEGGSHLEKTRLSAEFRVMSRTFLESSLRLAVWEPAGPGYWSPVGDVREALQFLMDNFPPEGELVSDDAERFVHYVLNTFRRAENLGRMYEELVREWRLPTVLATLMDYHEGNNHNPPEGSW